MHQSLETTVKGVLCSKQIVSQIKLRIIIDNCFIVNKQEMTCLVRILILLTEML